jgi:hypothetical protein
VALIASSKRNFLSFISVSVTAPTRITAIPPDNFAMRSCNFSFSYAVSALLTCFRIVHTEYRFHLTVSPVATIVVVSLLTMTRRA